MDIFSLLFLRFIHIAAMAALFAASVSAAGDVRRTVAAGPAHADLLQERMRRTSILATIAGWTTILSGIALIVMLGGFGAVSPAIHIGLLLTLIMIPLGMMQGRTATQAVEALRTGADTLPPARRLAMLSHTFHLLWAMVLLLMVFRHAVFS